MMLSPAMQPEATGMVYMSFVLAAFFSRIQTINAPGTWRNLGRGGGQRDAHAVGEGV